MYFGEIRRDSITRKGEDERVPLNEGRRIRLRPAPWGGAVCSGGRQQGARAHKWFAAPGVIAALVACFALNLSGCKEATQGSGIATASVEFNRSRQQLGKASERLFQEARPFTDRAALAARLKLDPARVRSFTAGGLGADPIAFDSGANCKMGHCTCVGDRDCNDMFSTICASPSTGGSCDVSGSEVVCTCKYVDARPASPS